MRATYTVLAAVPPQADGAHRRRTPVDFFEQFDVAGAVHGKSGRAADEEGEAWQGAADELSLLEGIGLTVGDTLYVKKPVAFPPIPAFAPEHFMVMRCKDNGRAKQFRCGVEQLDSEGVVQVLRGDQAPVPAAVGPLQLDVVAIADGRRVQRPVDLARLDYSVARITDKGSAPTLGSRRGVEVLTRTLDGALLAADVPD